MSVNWQDVVLKKTSTISQAIKKLNETGYGIILVTNKNNNLLGTLTDGDIRRAMIKHISLNSPIKDIMFEKPLTAFYKTSDTELLKILSHNSILQLPLVDEDNKIVGLKILNKIIETKKFENPIFIMAGGFGKRLNPLTFQTPKPMLQIGGEPILEKIIKKFITSGFQNFYISTFYKSEVIKNYFKTGAQWDISIKYIDEKKPLGTAGALSLLPYKTFDKPIIMINGDLITDLDIHNLLQYHEEQENIITIGAKKYDLEVPYGVLETDNIRLTSITEKPKHSFFINAGIYVINPKSIEYVKPNIKIDMPQWITYLINKKINVNIFPIHEYWLDIGEKSQYERALLENKEN